jgi:hypothetical protein
MNKYLIDHPGFAVVTTRLEVGEAIDMDEGTQARLSYLLRSAFQYMAAQQFLHRRGLFDDAMWNRYLDYARRIVSTPAGDWWTEEKQRAPYSPEFVAALEGRK